MKVAQTRSSAEYLRRSNSALILRALRRRGALAHTEIIEETDLASGTVSAITADLVQFGIIQHTERHTAGGRGRPRVLFEPAGSYGYLVTIAISSDAIQFSLVDYAGKLLDRFDEARRNDAESVDPFVEALQRSLERLLQRSQVPADKVLGISVSSKGIVDPVVPVLKWSPIFGSRQVDFAEVFSVYANACVLLSNETFLVASALSANHSTSAGGIVALSLGHSIGLGVALFADGKEPVVHAPNFGHMLHVPNGPKCRCGSNGCIEAYCGFYAILRTAFEVPKDTVPAKFVPITEVDRIADSARRGDRMATFAFRQAGAVLGNGLSRLLSLYGFMPIIITGPGVRFFELMREGLESGLVEAHVTRMQGMPEITVRHNEPELVFKGHTSRSLNIMDERTIGM